MHKNLARLKKATPTHMHQTKDPKPRTQHERAVRCQQRQQESSVWNHHQRLCCFSPLLLPYMRQQSNQVRPIRCDTPASLPHLILCRDDALSPVTLASYRGNTFSPQSPLFAVTNVISSSPQPRLLPPQRRHPRRHLPDRRLRWRACPGSSCTVHSIAQMAENGTPRKRPSVIRQ